jgi:type I restriction enzyme S subunit
MTDNLHQLAGQMVALFRQAVPLANLEVNAIIQSGERDTQRIEHQLDHMLGFCCDPDMLVVFKRLCRYYYGMDPVAAAEYVQAYREMWDMPDEVVLGGWGMSFDSPPTLRIGDFAKVKGGKRMPAGTALTPQKSKHPYLRIVDFKDGGIDKSNLQYVPDEVFPQIARYVISSRDLYISIVGTIGLVGAVPVELSGANLTENAAKICEIDETRVDERYLGYFLRSESGQTAISALTVGSTQPKLALFRIDQIEVPCPPLVEQQRIAALLSALDDRITLLRETNATLEAIAQALFKSWFVDFDPVRAKLEGRAPEGMDEATARLFPDSFEESELGQVPRGWRVGVLTQISKISSGNRPNVRSDAITTAAPIPLFGGAGIMGFTNESLFQVRKILTGRVGTLGKAHIAYPPFWASDNVLVLSPEEGHNFHFCFHWLKSIDVHSLNRGSTQPLLTQKDLGKQQHAIPTEAVLGKFAAIAEVTYEAIRENAEQAQTLTTLRDTLLPRLISGQLRLPEAQAAAEEALA